MTNSIIALINLTDFTVAYQDPNAVMMDPGDLFVATSEDDLGELTGPQAVSLYNAICRELNASQNLGLSEVNRFADKKSANKRLWANIVDFADSHTTLDEHVATTKATTEALEAGHARSNQIIASGLAEDKKPRRGTGVTLVPMKAAYACRAGTKQALLVDLLSREQGATMDELLTALSGGAKPWKEVTVKSGLNWDMNKVKGYGIRTTKRGDADCYHLVLPEGLKAPIPHTPRKGG